MEQINQIKRRSTPQRKSKSVEQTEMLNMTPGQGHIIFLLNTPSSDDTPDLGHIPLSL